jgi:phenylacetate-CoA ligase
MMTDLNRRFPWLRVLSWLCRPAASLEEVRRCQSRRLSEVVSHAAKYVPAYQGMIHEFRGLHDLHHVPTLSRSRLADPLASGLLSGQYRPSSLICHLTSGSTGHPTRIHRTWHEERALGLLRLAVLYGYGWRPHFKRANIVTLFNKTRNLPHELLSRLGLFRMRNFDCFDTAETLAEQLADYGPTILHGYASSVARVAGYLQAHKQLKVTPRWLALGGEALTPLARKQISAAFPGSKIYDLYGATEFNLVASECPHTGLYHLCEQGVFFEVLDESGRSVPVGEVGRVHGSALHSFAQPILRVPLGDLARQGPAPCPCGHPCGTLESIVGREVNTLTLSDGTELHPYQILNEVVENCQTWLQQYRLIGDEQKIVLEVVAPDATAVQLDNLKSQIARVLEHRVQTEVRPVEQIPLDASGKVNLCRLRSRTRQSETLS